MARKWWLSLCIVAVLLGGCDKSQPPTNVLRIASSNDPGTLDPRKARHLTGASTINMLFEGLMRIDPAGNLEPGIAESYTISPDHLTYTFNLRDAKWSNGDPVTAADFIHSWTSMLRSDFPAPNAFHLYVIKNAATAKRGETALEDVGVAAPSPNTLVVTLERPTPYFLELTTFHPFFPINHLIDKKNPQWTEQTGDGFVSNGPFKLASRKYEVNLEKNPNYWDADVVKLDGINIVVADSDTALTLFETGELDWVGSPMGEISPDAVPSLKESGKLGILPAAGTHWFRLNTEQPPLNDVRVRRALALAIDRQAIVEHVLQGGQQPATSLIPPSGQWQSSSQFKDHDLVLARELMQEALGDSDPQLTFMYGSTPRNQKIAQIIQQQWREAFGFTVALEGIDTKVFYDRLSRGQYQIANGSWFADYRDPYNFLAVFEAKNNGTNNTGWENPLYTELLKGSANSGESEERKRLLAQAEELLMSEMPVIPLFFYTFNYRKSPRVEGIQVTDTGLLYARNGSLR